MGERKKEQVSTDFHVWTSARPVGKCSCFHFLEEMRLREDK